MISTLIFSLTIILDILFMAVYTWCHRYIYYIKRSYMSYRYDISPDRYPSTKWLVIDTMNNNSPVSSHNSRAEAYRECLRLDTRGTRVKR